MSDNSLKILFGVKLPRDIPKISVGKLLFDRLKQGNQDVALIDAHTGNTLTYHQILQRSVKLAYYYKKNHVNKGDVIAIVSENDINYVIPALAALYVGAVVHATAAHLTLWELSTMFRVSQPKLIFCSETALPVAKQLKNQFLCIENIVTFGAKAEGAISLEDLLGTNGPDLIRFEPDELNPEEDVAYIFSSSGTTGLPKCVMLTHYNVVASIEIYKKIRNWQQDDVLLIPVTFSHIFGFSYLIGALTTPTKCVIMKKFLPELYLRCIELYKVSNLGCPPLLLKFLAQSPLVDHYDLSSIRDITYGSAPSDPEIDAVIKKRLNVTPRQIYGTTETVGGCLYTPISLNKTGSCGIVAPEHMAKVCDVETQLLLGPNQPGEICIKGPIVMKGYMGNPEDTKNSIDHDGFYHTGDVGYYDEDSYFFIVDRIKDLIKYKGYQVSPSELEYLISRHPAVKEVAVIGIPDERAGEIPLAYVIANETYYNNITEKEIVDFVAERISANKRLYGGVKFVKEIPKNNNGKMLKRVLREMHIKSVTT